jgi:aldose 1-epimerase
VDLLRRAPAGAIDPLAMASFPLVPYANRIAHGRHGAAGHQLARNFGDHPHSLHGFGWQAAWTASETGESAVTLVHDHDGNAGWPWPYRAQQRIALSASQLSMSLSIENRGDTAMPAGLGFHPYVAADAGTALRFGAKRMWLATPDMLPDREAAADALGDWANGLPVAGDALIDNVYAGWTGPAVVTRGDGWRLAIGATGAPFLHLYRPPGQAFFCLEPVNHLPDAINRAGMPMVAPGASASLSMTIAIDKGDGTLPKPAAFA